MENIKGIESIWKIDNIERIKKELRRIGNGEI